MLLIVGLGNPGKEYEKTPHNAGFMTLNKLSSNFSAQKKVFGKIASLTIAGKKVFLLKPDTFMNESGKSVAAAAKYHKIPLENILIIHDDLDIPLGSVKVSHDRGAARHKGVMSVITAMPLTPLTRIRIGIGREPKPLDASSYVLTPLDEASIESLNRGIAKTIETLTVFIEQGLSKAQQTADSQEILNTSAR